MSNDNDALVETLAEALGCECGHSVGGEHNGLGCYATIDYGTRTQRRCDCTLTDDQDPLDRLAPTVADLIDKAVAERLAAVEAVRDKYASPSVHVSGRQSGKTLASAIWNDLRAALGGER